LIESLAPQNTTSKSLEGRLFEARAEAERFFSERARITEEWDA